MPLPALLAGVDPSAVLIFGITMLWMLLAFFG
jgi:hypothetical protein